MADPEEGPPQWLDPSAPRFDAMLAAAVLDMLADENGPPGIAEDVALKVHQLRHDPETRMLKTLAKAAHISMSQARHRWQNTDDLAWELADIAATIEDATDTHDGCGTKPTDWWEWDEGRGQFKRVDPGPWKFKLVDCYACAVLDDLNTDLQKDKSTKAGTRWVIAPRGPDDPEIDSG